jgi:AbrB family looped-hinge helix DNA binding protein
MDRPYFKTRLRPKGQVTIPTELRDLLGAQEGDDLLFYQDESGRVVISRAQIIPPDQAWFWAQRWQQMEREAQADIDAGRVVSFDQVEDAIRFLNDAADEEEGHAESNV